MKRRILTLLALGIVYVVWGSTFYGVKLALQGGLRPFFLIGLRFLTAGCALYGLARWRGAPAAARQDWMESALLGFLLLVCGTGLVAWSVQWISSSLAALLVATSPVWVTLLDREQKLTPRKWLGLLLGLLGVGWLVGASLSFGSATILLGSMGCLASALAWAVGSLRARSAGAHVSPVTRAAMQMIWAGAMLLVLSLGLEEWSTLGLVSEQAWWAFTYLTLFGSLVAYSAYTWLVANVSATVVATHAYVNPVVAVLLGALLGDEAVSAQTGLAATVALLGVVVLMMPARPLATRPALALVSAGPRSGRPGDGRGGPSRRRRRAPLRAS